MAVRILAVGNIFSGPEQKIVLEAQGYQVVSRNDLQGAMAIFLMIRRTPSFWKRGLRAMVIWP